MDNTKGTDQATEHEVLDPFDHPYTKTLVEIETAVVVATILSDTFAAVAMAKLSGDDFSAESNRRLFDAARRVRERLGKVDEVTVRAELLHDPNLDVTLELLDVIHRWTGIPSLANGRVWISTIVDASRRRRYAELLARLLIDLRGGRDVDEVDAELSGWLELGRLRIAA